MFVQKTNFSLFLLKCTFFFIFFDIYFKIFIIILVILLVLSILGILIYLTTKSSANENEDLSKTLPQKIFEKEKGKIDKYTLYGTHFNINGSLKINSNDITLANSKLFLIMENTITTQENIL